MRWPSRRVLPTMIGLAAATTVTVDVLVVLDSHGRPGDSRAMERYVATAGQARYTPTEVGPLHREIIPHVLVAAPQTLPPDVIAGVRAVRGVENVEVTDAARVLVAGKRVGVMGVEPATFRAYTPGPSAKSDALWRNITNGDVAVSFPMGKDGGVPLGSWTQVGGAGHQTSVRVGAYATMGVGQVDAVVSHATARAIGMPMGNALLVSAPHQNVAKLRERLAKVLPKDVRTAALESRYEGPSVPGGAPANGKVLTAQQVNTVIRAAESKIGMPYVWGGESDREGGYDCSGLVQYAFAKAGVRMPRTADIQAFTGWKLPYSQAQPGDLLTWKNDPTFNGVSHIAIYLGNNKMVVARRTGTLIAITPVYLSNFWGAIRVNPRQAAQKAGGG